MEKRIKTKWLKALRSGKYKQTTRFLKDENGYCCLGVLCDLHRLSKVNKRARWIDSEYNPGISSESTDSVLPKSVMRWSGLKEEEGRFVYGKKRNNLFINIK